jgi:hypothetical protein
MNEEITEEELMVEEDLRMDPEFEKELMATFVLELSELLAIYRNSLGEIRSIVGDKPQAYKELFRVYHTLKGDAGYFEEFAEFTKFATYHCEILRHADQKVWDDPKILQIMSTNYSLISTVYHTLSKGRNLQALKFHINEDKVEEEVQVDEEVIIETDQIDEEIQIDTEVEVDEDEQLSIEAQIDEEMQKAPEAEADEEVQLSIEDQIDEVIQIDDEIEADEEQIDEEIQIGDEIEADEEQLDYEVIIENEEQIDEEIQIGDEIEADEEQLDYEVIIENEEQIDDEK